MSVGAPQVAMVFMGMPIFILLSLTCILCLFCVIKTNIIFSIQKCQVDADVYQNKIKKISTVCDGSLQTKNQLKR